MTDIIKKRVFCVVTEHMESPGTIGLESFRNQEWQILKTAFISDGSLKLEPLAADPDKYRKLVHEVWTDPAVVKQLPEGAFPTEASIDTWLNGLPDSEDRVYWAVTDVPSGKTVGITGLYDIEWHKVRRTCEFSTQLLPEGRGHGIGKRLGTMALVIAKNAGFTNIFADIYSNNVASTKTVPAFLKPVQTHDESGKDVLFYEADLRTYALPKDIFLAYVMAPVKRIRKTR